MPQEKLNWDTSAVFLDNRYHTKETWRDKDGKDLHPQQAYFTIFYIAFQFAGAILELVSLRSLLVASLPCRQSAML